MKTWTKAFPRGRNAGMSASRFEALGKLDRLLFEGVCTSAGAIPVQRLVLVDRGKSGGLLLYRAPPNDQAEKFAYDAFR